MTDNEFLLYDRTEKIKSVISQYGEENFFVSFSGGKDSTVLHYLVDMAIPNNSIPRVYADTGIELNMIRDFVYEMKKNDDRIEIITPSSPIKPMLENEGYPFKSKLHSDFVMRYRRNGLELKGIRSYLGMEDTRSGKPISRPCPKKLMYQFTDDFNLKVSDMCCKKLKTQPIAEWKKRNNKKYGILGIMRSEGGRRGRAQCLAFRQGKLLNFQPMAPLTKEWEEWFIDEYKIPICDIYYPPYNFERTGCKGCPFAIHLQEQLDTLEEFFPNERKQCEYIWGPVYEEYRRIGYRLRKEEKQEDEQIEGQMSIFDFMDAETEEST